MERGNGIPKESEVDTRREVSECPGSHFRFLILFFMTSFSNFPTLEDRGYELGLPKMFVVD